MTCARAPTRITLLIRPGDFTLLPRAIVRVHATVVDAIQGVITSNIQLPVETTSTPTISSACICTHYLLPLASFFLALACFFLAALFLLIAKLFCFLEEGRGGIFAFSFCGPDASVDGRARVCAERS